MGRDYLDDQQWLKAQQKLNEYVTSYPSDKNVDQGLYWLAYSQLKLEQYRDCQRTLTRLFARYPNSTWGRDGSPDRDAGSYFRAPASDATAADASPASVRSWSSRSI